MPDNGRLLNESSRFAIFGRASVDVPTPVCKSICQPGRTSAVQSGTPFGVLRNSPQQSTIMSVHLLNASVAGEQRLIYWTQRYWWGIHRKTYSIHWISRHNGAVSQRAAGLCSATVGLRRNSGRSDCPKLKAHAGMTEKAYLVRTSLLSHFS